MCVGVMKSILEGRLAAAGIELVVDYCGRAAAMEQEVCPSSPFVSLTPVPMSSAVEELPTEYWVCTGRPAPYYYSSFVSGSM